ncbi:MAG: DNA repair protein RecO [Clostridiales bacterium]|nr:DNA repair protein RecO [Clostridiales bacterium]
MSVFQARGIVLRESESGEADKKLTVFAKTYGKIFVTARGARKIKSKILSAAQLFTYADFVIYDGGKFRTLSQADVIERFYNLRQDYDRFVLAQYLVRLVDRTLPYDTPADELLHLLVISISALAKGIRDPLIVVRAFEIKFFQLNGLSPRMDYCAECDKPIESEAWFGKEGTVCNLCKKFPAVRIDSNVIAAIKYVLEADLGDIFKFRLNPQTLSELTSACKLFLEINFIKL